MILPLLGVSDAFNRMIADSGLGLEAERAAFLEFATYHYPNGYRMSGVEFGERFAAWLAARLPAQEHDWGRNLLLREDGYPNAPSTN